MKADGVLKLKEIFSVLLLNLRFVIRWFSVEDSLFSMRSVASARFYVGFNRLHESIKLS